MFEKTDEGRKAIQTRHVRLSPCQRAVLITVNGTQSAEELTATAAKMGGGPNDVQTLLDLGLIASLPAPVWQEQATHMPNPPGYSASTSASTPIEDAPAGKAPISMDSLWPESMSAPTTAHELAALQASPEFADSLAFEEAPEATAAPDFGAAKSFVLGLLEPLGLRAIQLRRTVEAAQNSAQLRDVEHLIRDLLDKDQNAQLDSAFFGLQ